MKITNPVSLLTRRSPGGATAIVLLAGLALMGACASASAPSLPDEFLGTWYYTGSSGGIGGDGMGDEPTGYIVITADDTIETYADDGTLIGTSSFTASMGESIFRTEPELMLEDPEGGFARVIRLSENGQRMSLSDNVYDGFHMGYARSR